MPTPELIDSAQKALSAMTRQPRDSEEEYYWRCAVVVVIVQAHEEWLAEQGLMKVPASIEGNESASSAVLRCLGMLNDKPNRRRMERAWAAGIEMISAALAEE